MTHYPKELKESVIQKMMPPNNVPISQLVRDTGIPDATLYTWRNAPGDCDYIPHVMKDFYMQFLPQELLSTNGCK